MITSKNGKVTVAMTKNGRHYVLGPAKLPKVRDPETIERCHQARLTTSRAVAQAWADRVEGLLYD